MSRSSKPNPAPADAAFAGIIKQQLAARIPLVIAAAAGLVYLLVSAVPRAVQRGGSFCLYSLLLVAAWLVLTAKWTVRLILLIRRFRAGSDPGKTRAERIFGVAATILAVLLAAASFAVYMIAQKSGSLPK